MNFRPIKSHGRNIGSQIGPMRIDVDATGKRTYVLRKVFEIASAIFGGRSTKRGTERPGGNLIGRLNYETQQQWQELSPFLAAFAGGWAHVLLGAEPSAGR